MKRALGGLTGLVLLASAGAATAADLYKPAAVPPPVVPYVLNFSWTGFYIGAHIGYGFGGDDDVGIRLDPPNAFLGDITSLENNGVFGGLHLGYNWQWGGLVVGLEAELNASGIGDSGDGPLGVLGIAGRAESDVTWYGVVGPRIGFAWDRLLVYGTGGFAFGGVDYDVHVVNAVDSVRLKDDDVQTGWALGAGLEWAFSPNWTARVEYKYVNFGRYTVSGEFLDVGGVDREVSTEATPDFHTVKFGVSYKFGYDAPPPAPAVVKY